MASLKCSKLQYMSLVLDLLMLRRIIHSTCIYTGYVYFSLANYSSCFIKSKQKDVAIQNFNLKKAVGIAIKSKQTSNQLEPVTRNISTLSCIDYCYNSKPNACTNKAFSRTSTRFNPYFNWLVCFAYIFQSRD